MDKQVNGNRSICGKCQKVVASRHEAREGKVYLVKECPQCGENEALVSSNAARWQQKREMCGYTGDSRTCGLNCTACNHGKQPTLVFLDVTNRCNMNCPICLANIPAMGFQFDPPMAYFEKVFTALAKLNPRPRIQLFGGEPTVREDIVEIIHLARAHGLQARVVTNGLRLADEAFCKRLLATGAQLMFAFDGRSPEVYQRIRKSTHAYERKLRALENVRKYRRSKITIMCCAGVGVNDEYLSDLVQYCHDGRDFIAALDLIPLKATWGPEQVDAVNTTIEDVERMMAVAVPGMEFVPAGMLLKIQTVLEVFGMKRITFGGAHPNCESVSVLVSDGQGYIPINRYLKRPFGEMLAEAVALDESMARKLKQSALARLFGKAGRQIVAGAALLRFCLRHARMRAVFKGSTAGGIARFLWGFLRGEKIKHLMRRYTRCQGILRVIVLPFEDADCIESARLVECPTAFAYEHPESGEIRMMPVCAWPMYKNEMLRAAAAKYGIAARADKVAESSEFVA